MEVLRRIDRGLLTGSALARATGFRHAHISNFLRHKRSLSLEAMDRVLAAEHISIFDLLPAQSGPATVPGTGPPASSVHIVPVVTHDQASTTPRVSMESILGTIDVPDSVIQLLRPRPAADRISWQRFVAVRADADHAAAMAPIVLEDSVLVIDRHYNSLAPYRPLRPTIYAVVDAGRLHISFLQFDADRLVLRPYAPESPVRLLELAAQERPSDRIIGRVCYIASEY